MKHGLLLLLLGIMAAPAALADPIVFTPVGGEFFGMGGAYTADYEDNTAILLNPAGTVTPRRRSKNKKKSGPSSTVSTGFTARLARRVSPDFLSLSTPDTHVYRHLRYAVNLMSTGTTGRFQVSKYSFPMGLGVYLRDSVFTRLRFERIVDDNAGRMAMFKDSDMYEGGVSAAVILRKRWAMGITLKAFYGTSGVGRYVEYSGAFGSGINNFQYNRQMWGVGASVGCRYQIRQDLSVGIAMDMPGLRIYERRRFRSAGTYRGGGLDTSYSDDYSQSGTRFSGPVIRLGTTWKPGKKWKLSADIIVNPWPARGENDFASAHLLSAALGASLNPAPRHKVAIGLTGRVLSRAYLRYPGDTRTWAAAVSLLYRYSSLPVSLPWVGKVIIRLAFGLRYTYTGGEIAGITAHYLEKNSQVSMNDSSLRFQSLDTLFRIAIVY